jgi:hypothetical protein
MLITGTIKDSSGSEVGKVKIDYVGGVTYEQNDGSFVDSAKALFAAPSESSKALALVGRLSAVGQVMKRFVPALQYKTIWSLSKGEEGEFFVSKMEELAKLIEGMPKTYDQDGKGNASIAYLHYFGGSADWYITEKDKEGDGTQQAFGLASLYGDISEGELGYISIEELVSSPRVELDLHYTPKTLAQIKGVAEDKPETDTITPEIETKAEVITPEAVLPETIAPVVETALESPGTVGSADEDRLKAIIGRKVSMMDAGLPGELETLFLKYENHPVLSALANEAVKTYTNYIINLAKGGPALDSVQFTHDQTFLDSLIDGSTDLFADAVLDQVTPMIERYKDNPEMSARVDRAATAYAKQAVESAMLKLE